MERFIRSVCAWNSKRYEQVPNRELNIALLTEEYLEYINSNNDVDIVDAIVDTLYITVGCLYKYGNSADSIIYMFNTYNYEYQEINCVVAKDIYKYIKAKNDTDRINALLSLMYSCYSKLQYIALNNDSVISDLMYTVCIANDSKAVPNAKVDPSIKANVDKGSSFIPPEESIRKILENLNKNI